MKKLTYSIIIFLLIFTLNINNQTKAYEYITKPLIVTKGYDYNNILQYDGYTIIKSNINFNNIGEYEIEYINNETHNTLIKKIYVVDENNHNTYLTEKTININTEYETIKLLSNNTYIYNIKEENKNTIYKVKNNQIIWEKELVSNNYSTIVDYYEENNLIYILSNNFVDSNYQINLYILNQYGETLLSQSYGGTKNDTSTGFEIDENYIYVYGTTLSSDGIFTHILKNEDSFILKINKKDLSIEKTYILSEQYLDKIISLKVEQDNIYILKQYVKLDIFRTGYKIQKINSIGEISDTYIFNHNIDFYPVKFDLVNNNLYILTNNDLTTKLYCLDTMDFRIEQIDNIENYKGIDIYTNPNTISVIYENDKNSKLVIYDLSNNQIINQEYEYSFKYFLNENNIITENNLILNINYLTIDKNNEKFKVKYNNKIMDYNHKSIITTNNHIFGTYQNFYYYETPIVDFCGYLNQNIDSNISVENNETYDININLTFNGTAYLNNTLIENNYLIKNPGEYTLKVIGNNIEKNITFKVLNLTTNQELIEDDLKYKNNININKINDPLDITVTKEERKNKDKPIYWYFIFPLISGCVLIMTFIKKRG